ncbi:serine hydrolase [Isoptericola sp. b408]|uniref:serine hydrolase domain-containing protein n=1 Tax=Isoptericola sp. b408 TaxID=3064653 RepID=UPI002712D152|nr:serine hydrolase domain-containing protein [Isoptericola sp. b408]MDO8151620.1 serine hydrolase domain-containing protein [Isoptericola sp. b408]
MSAATAIDLDAEVEAIRHRRAAVGIAVGLVEDGVTTQVATSGLADLATGSPVSADTAFRVASITKTFTGVAVLQLVERGLVDLDAPANDYLRSFRLAPPGPAPITVRQLLTHTAGLPESLSLRHAVRPDFGESTPADVPAPALGDYYGGVLHGVAEPGTRFCYTNHGPATLGQIVEDVTGSPLADHLAEHVFAPWGMTSTDLDQSRPGDPRRATGYRLTARGPRPVPVTNMATIGAAAAWSTPVDMLRYAEALVGGGANAHGRALAPGTVAEMDAPHYQPDPRIPGMGLAFFRGRLGDHPTAEHQGIIPGFDSVLVLAPDARTAVFLVVTGARLGMFWVPDEANTLLRRVLGVPPAAVRTDVAQRPEVWNQVCGTYTLPGALGDLRLRSVVGAGIQVLVRRGRLVLRCLHPVPFLYRGVELAPDDPEDPFAFRLDLTPAGLSPIRVVFAPDPESGRTAMHLEVMPLTAYRRGRATT